MYLNVCVMFNVMCVCNACNGLNQVPDQCNIVVYRHFRQLYMRAEKPKNNVCGTFDFLSEPENFMCTYNILFLQFCKSYSFFWNIFYEKVQKNMQFGIY